MWTRHRRDPSPASQGLTAAPRCCRMTSMRQATSLAVSVLAALALWAVPALGAGTITTIAGPGDISTPGDGGPASQAYVGVPISVIALADSGYLIVHQSNPAIRRVSPDGTIMTI